MHDYSWHVKDIDDLFLCLKIAGFFLGFIAMGVLVLLYYVTRA